MIVMDALKRYLGWCPREMSWRESTTKDIDRSVTNGTPGCNRTHHQSPGWWNIYHNQLLVMAVLVSVTATALFLLIGELSGYTAIVSGIAIGIGSSIGFLAGFEKKYDRIITGQFVRGSGTGSERIKRYLRLLTFSVPATLVTLAIFVVLFALLDLIGPILGLMLGFSIIAWIILCITVFWERRQRMTLISENGSMYALKTGNPLEGEEFVCR